MGTQYLNESVKNFEQKTEQLKDDLFGFLDEDSTVFISPHVYIDFDALSSATSMYEICKILGKKVFIVIDDDEEVMRKNDPKLFNMLQEAKNNCSIITIEQMRDIRNSEDCKNERLIVVDTNNESRVQVKEDLYSFEHIMVIDHHSISATPVKAEYNYVIPATSACEIITQLFILFDMVLTEKTSGDLLTGIWLDTSRLTNATVSSKTMSILSVLLAHGANINRADRMFKVPLEDMQKEQELFDSARHESFDYSIAYNETEIYKDTSLSRVADRLNNLGRDVVFAVGFVEVKEKGQPARKVVAIKARSNNRGKDTVDVDAIMKNFGGGGDTIRAAAIVETENILSVVDAIVETLKPGLSFVDTSEAKEKVYSFIERKNK